MSFAVFLCAQHEVRFGLFPFHFNSFQCFTVVEDYLVITLRELGRIDLFFALLCLVFSRSAQRLMHLYARPRLVRINLFIYLTPNIRIHFLPSEFVDYIDDRGLLRSCH